MHLVICLLLLGFMFLILIEKLEAVDIFSTPQEFCYTDAECGPDSEKWFGLCHSGTAQSPINLQVANRYPNKYAVFPLQQFGADHFFIQNNGHTINVDFTPVGKGSKIFPGYGLSSTEYRFSNAHFHWGPINQQGSEHQLNGRNFSMEMHLVHFNENYKTIKEAVNSGDPNALSVIGIFMQVDESVDPNPALVPLVQFLTTIQETHTYWMKVESPLDLVPLIPVRHGSTVYAYKGSLTTPSCNEQVNWYIFEEPVIISSQDVEAFRSVFDGRGRTIWDNRRPIQPIHRRHIDVIKIA